MNTNGEIRTQYDASKAAWLSGFLTSDTGVVHQRKLKWQERRKAMSCNTDQIDREVLREVGQEPFGVTDLHEKGYRIGTVKNSLARLLKRKLVKRRYDGGAGRYLYVHTSSPLPDYHFQ